MKAKHWIALAVALLALGVLLGVLADNAIGALVGVFGAGAALRGGATRSGPDIPTKPPISPPGTIEAIENEKPTPPQPLDHGDFPVDDPDALDQLNKWTDDHVSG